MFYVYRCPECGAEDEENRSIADRDNPLLCFCKDPEDPNGGTNMRRVLGAGVQFQPMPRNQKDYDIPTRGMDKTDLKAMIQKDERDYEGGWNGANPSRPKRKHERTKMAELGKQFKGARVAAQ